MATRTEVTANEITVKTWKPRSVVNGETLTIAGTKTRYPNGGSTNRPRWLATFTY